MRSKSHLKSLRLQSFPCPIRRSFTHALGWFGIVSPSRSAHGSMSGCPVRYCRLHRQRTFHATGPCRPASFNSTDDCPPDFGLASTCFHEAGERRPGQLPYHACWQRKLCSRLPRRWRGPMRSYPSRCPVPSRESHRSRVIDLEYMTGGTLQGQVVNSPVFAQKVLRSGVGAFHRPTERSSCFANVKTECRSRATVPDRRPTFSKTAPVRPPCDEPPELRQSQLQRAMRTPRPKRCAVARSARSSTALNEATELLGCAGVNIRQIS